jgi:hypothetical protein
MRPVEHRSKASADHAIDEARERYRRGVKSLRLLRLTDPDGRLTIIDFEREVAQEHPLLVELAQATQARLHARVAAENASAQWEKKIIRSAAAGLPRSQIAQAAGTTVAHVDALLSRRRT